MIGVEILWLFKCNHCQRYFYAPTGSPKMCPYCGENIQQLDRIHVHAVSYNTFRDVIANAISRFSAMYNGIGKKRMKVIEDAVKLALDYYILFHHEDGIIQIHLTED